MLLQVKPGSWKDAAQWYWHHAIPGMRPEDVTWPDRFSQLYEHHGKFVRFMARHHVFVNYLPKQLSHSPEFLLKVIDSVLGFIFSVVVAI